MAQNHYSNKLHFYINGLKIIEDNPDPEWSLLFYLRRKLFLTGTKNGCSEGGCGVCTVMISRFDDQNKIRHFSANSCLIPVVWLDSMSVTTIEGIGSVKTRLHPIQDQLAKSHGAQCGFCTPGFIMSMYALLRNNPQPSMNKIEENLAGNLCRCTGYRPIVESFKSFSSECGSGVCCGKNKCSLENEQKDTSNEGCSCFNKTKETSQEVIFPPELMIGQGNKTKSLHFVGHNVEYFRPTTLKEFLNIKMNKKEAKVIAGNTEIGVETKFKNMFYPTYISTSGVKEFHSCYWDHYGLYIGASAALTDVEYCIVQAVKGIPDHQERICSALLDVLSRFSGKQIKNVATMGGNIMTGSPISDLMPILMASKSMLHFMSQDGHREICCDNNFFTGYRQNTSRPDEVLAYIFIPFLNKDEYICAFKQSRRRDDDLAIVNAAFKISFKSDKVSDLRIAYGGVAPTVVMPLRTMKQLESYRLNSKLLEAGTTSLLSELTLDPSAPGGMVEYKQALIASFFHKFYWRVSQDLNGTKKCKDDLSAIPACQGVQVYQEVPETQKEQDPIGRPIQNVFSQELTTGEASFTDDILPIDNELFGALVLSSEAKARIVKIDESEALKVGGVYGFLCARDIPELNNRCGIPGVLDEEVFASKEVNCVGQIIGVILANDEATARKACKLVEVTYDRVSKPIITIEDAKAASSYWGPWTINTGDVEKAFESSEHFLQGRISIGGQEHFYLEPNAHIAIPRDANELEVISTCQDLAGLQKDIARVIGCPLFKVVCKVKRIGGGFGGKERRSIAIALPAAFAAYKLSRPVRIVLDRHEDMLITGGRHPMTCNWKAGFRKDGRILGLEVTLHSNAGWSLDVSDAAMHLCMLKFDNSYKIENWRITGFCCKTNLPSNTCHRGTGAPQAIIMMENIITKIADFLRREPNQVRSVNFYGSPRDVNHFGMTLNDITLHKCWNEVLSVSSYEDKLEEINRYNQEHSLRKKGISAIPIKYGNSFLPTFLNQAGALVLVYTDGTVLLSYGGIEMGQGLHTKMIQVASRVLEIPMELIFVNGTATDKVANASPTAASVTSDLCGMAIIDACDKIKKRLRIYKEKEPNSTWSSWVEKAYMDRVSLSAVGHYLAEGMVPFDFETQKGSPFNYFSYGAAVTEVEVDCTTGDHVILRTDIVMDVGKSLNPSIDVGQIEGAFVHGSGLYTLEELKYSTRGELLTRGPGTYKIPGVKDVAREFNVHLLKESVNPMALYSSKAIGEPPLLLASSVFFAIREAVKAYRISNGRSSSFEFDSPATAETIRMACSDPITDKIKSPLEGTFEPWGISPF